VAAVFPEGAPLPARGTEEWNAAERKRSAWEGLRGLRRRDAMAKFVALVEEAVPEWEVFVGLVSTPTAGERAAE
jgi:hypothetical protein